MGIIDTIKGFFQQRESTKGADHALDAVKEAAKRENYNHASIKAFHALETMGSVYVNAEREIHQTAREYAKHLTDEGYATEEELEPIIVGFEIAKYSELQVSYDDYSEVEKSLDTVATKFKKGKSQPTKKSRKGGRRRRRPRRGGKTGAARSRKRRSRKNKE